MDVNRASNRAKVNYPEPPKDKEWLYVGYYLDTENRFILKIGTTNNLYRRKLEHTRKYHQSPEYTLPKKSSFNYIWFIPLSKYNTLRFEDRNRQAWQDANIGEFIRNDRFYCAKRPEKVTIKIRKEYTIDIGAVK